MRKRTQARECAVQILYQHEMNPTDIGDSLAAFWQQNNEFSQETRTFAEKLVTGTLDHQETLDSIVSKYTENWQIWRMAVIDRNILRLATYEMLFVEEIPPKVTINEAVNIAKKFSQEESGKFVNGVLDKISHTEEKRYPSSEIPPAT